MSDYRFGVSPVNYPDPDGDPILGSNLGRVDVPLVDINPTYIEYLPALTFPYPTWVPTLHYRYLYMYPG